MTGGDFVFCNDDVRKIAASSAAMTGELIATIFLRKLLGGDTFIYALFDNKTNCVIIKKTFDKREFSAYDQSINQ